MKRRGVITLAAVLVLATIGVGATAWHTNQQPHLSQRRASLTQRAASDAHAPATERIRVRVLNATRTRGVARRATRYLRDLGFDVVESGNSRETRDSTVVIDHSHHAEWAARVGKAMGARVVSRPDSSRYLDVTVLVGASWRAPAEAFHP